MNAKRRWYELLLHGMVILLVLASGTLRTAKAYDYIQDDWEEYEEEDDHTTPARGSSWEVWGDATASTFSVSTYACNCWAKAYSRANDDRADAYASSQASWLTSWTWNGPPESNPPGGDLEWVQTVYESLTDAAAWGYNTTSGISISSAQSDSWSFGTDGSSWTDIEVLGYIANGSVDGYWDQDADPPEDFTDGVEDSYTTPPNYSYSIDGWSFSTTDTETIASGTTYVYFTGGIDCDVDTTTISSEETSPWANAYGEIEAGNDVWADFP